MAEPVAIRVVLGYPLLTPDITTVAAIEGDVTTVAGIHGDVTTVAGIASNVTAVANIDANVTAVAGNATNVNTVAGSIANVNTVGGSIASVNTVAARDAAIATVASRDADIGTVASRDAAIGVVAARDADIAIVAGIDDEIVAVAGDAADISAVAGIISDVSKVAAIDGDVSTVAAIDDDVTVAVAIAGDISTVAGDIADIQALGPVSAAIATVAGIESDVTTVANIASAVSSVASNETNINTVASDIADVTTVAGIASAVSAVAAIDDDVSAVASDAVNIAAVAGDIANVNAVAGNATNINAVASNESNINTAVTNISDINTVAGNIANITTVAGMGDDIDAILAEKPAIDAAVAELPAIIAAPTQAQLAEKWADEDEDVPVDTDPDRFSAKHHAAKAAASAGTANNDAGAAQDARTGAEEARDLSRDWAEKEDGEDVDGVGTRSAKHHAGQAASSAAFANDDAGAAQDAKEDAEAARDKAAKWAEEDEDVAVEPDQYSALHHATKAAASAQAAAQSAQDAQDAVSSLDPFYTPASVTQGNLVVWGEDNRTIEDGGPIPEGFSGDWSDLDNVPSTFPPSPHNHAIGDVTGLQNALDGKQPAGSYATAAQGEKADSAVQPGDFGIGTPSGQAAPLLPENTLNYPVGTIAPGIYAVNSNTSGNPFTGYGTVLVTRRGVGGGEVQLGLSENPSGRLYQRARVTGDWSDWVEKANLDSDVSFKTITAEAGILSQNPPSDPNDSNEWFDGIAIVPHASEGWAPESFMGVLHAALNVNRAFQMAVGANGAYLRRLHSSNNGTQWQTIWTDTNFDPDDKANTSALTSHTNATDNPHGVTKAQVGLGNVSNNAQLKIASNLSDLNNAGTARNNLGLKSGATIADTVSTDEPTGGANNDAWDVVE